MIVPGVYKHYSGGLYQVLFEARHTEPGTAAVPEVVAALEECIAALNRCSAYTATGPLTQSADMAVKRAEWALKSAKLDGERLVVYLPLYAHKNGGLVPQARPSKMWDEEVDFAVSGKKKRFTYVGHELPPEVKS